MRSSHLFRAVCRCTVLLVAFFAAVLPVRGAETAPVSSLTPGPIRHATLPDALEARIRNIGATFAEVMPRSHDEWMDGFKRDVHPEDEVVIWERIGAAYQKFISSNKLDKAGREEVLGLLLIRSAADEQYVLANAKLRKLSPAQAREVMRLYGAPPQPISVAK